jgi:hypothetical protein
MHYDGAIFFAGDSIMFLPSFIQRRAAAAAAGLALISLTCVAESHNPADYPLRIHIFRVSSHVHRRNGVVWWVDGDGRANLFENGNPAGIDFAYRCSDRFMDSSGYETYPAKWRHPGQSLVILTHQIGSDSTEPCVLKVDVKEFVYMGRNSDTTGSPAVLKQWMIDHHYDPEHGLDEPDNPRDPQQQ